MRIFTELRLRFTFCMLVVLPFLTFAQPAFTPYASSDSTIYDVMFQLVDNNVMPTYIAIPFVTPIAPRVKHLSNDEGGGFYITEISPNLIYTILRGRPQGTSCRQRMRLSVVYNPALRMVVSDHSNPILPTNQKAGFRFDFIFKNKNEKLICTPKTHFDPEAFTRKNIHLFDSHVLTFHAMHYSNGQTDSVPDLKDPVINNYRNGDFSTNYLSLMYTFNRLTDSNRVYQFGTGIQWDWGIKNFVLAYSDGQINRYGHLRLLASFQHNSKPHVYGKRSYVWVKYQPCAVDTHCYNKFVVHRFRVQSELIVGNLRDYRTDLSRAYRLGVYLIYEIDFLKWRNVGLFFQLYGGRDYLNIRYDDIIASATVGFTFRFAKIFPVYYNARPKKLELDKCEKKKPDNFLLK